MSLICYSLTDADVIYCKFLAETRPENAIEVNIDKLHLSEDEIKELFSIERGSYLIAACHCSLPSETETAVKSLTEAILSGADYVEIGSDIQDAQRRWLVSVAMNRGCRTILSYTNREATPTHSFLCEFADNAFRMGADIVKIVTRAKTEADSISLLSLYDRYKADSLIAYTTGKDGAASRLASYAKGAPIFYLEPFRSCDADDENREDDSAPTYFDFVKKENIVLKGKPSIEPDQEAVSRIILLASLTQGETRLYGRLPRSLEVSSAFSVARSLGADITLSDDVTVITGHQNISEGGLQTVKGLIDAGSSHLLARMCIPIAGLSSTETTVTVSENLSHIKASEYRGALKRLGLKLQYTEGEKFPVIVGGSLHHGCVKLNGIHGHEVLSGLMIALSQCPGESFVSINGVEDAPELDRTATTGTFFNLEDPTVPVGFGEKARTYDISGNQNLRNTIGIELEKDWNYASYFLVAGAMMGEITVDGMDFYSEQTDVVIYDFLKQCRVDIKKYSKSLNVRKSIICPFLFDLHEAPGLFAPLFLLALRADGESCISGLKTIRTKEFDRAKAFRNEFSKLGAVIRIFGDAMYIRGLDSVILDGCKCSCYGDVPLAMALSIASLIAGDKVEIEGAECISSVHPSFYANIEMLANKTEQY